MEFLSVFFPGISTWLIFSLEFPSVFSLEFFLVHFFSGIPIRFIFFSVNDRKSKDGDRLEMVHKLGLYQVSSEVRSAVNHGLDAAVAKDSLSKVAARFRLPFDFCFQLDKVLFFLLIVSYFWLHSVRIIRR